MVVASLSPVMSMFAVALLMADFVPYKLDIFWLEDHLNLCHFWKHFYFLNALAIFLMNLPENCYLQAYADDAILICTHSSLDDCIDITNQALALIFEWGLENKLTFNPTKTQAMIAKYDFAIRIKQ